MPVWDLTPKQADNLLSEITKIINFLSVSHFVDTHSTIAAIAWATGIMVVQVLIYDHIISLIVVTKQDTLL